MVPQGASVLFRPVQAVALSSGLKDPLTFNPKPNCNLQNVLTRMCSLLKQIPFFFFSIFKRQYYAVLCHHAGKSSILTSNFSTRTWM